MQTRPFLKPSSLRQTALGLTAGALLAGAVPAIHAQTPTPAGPVQILFDAGWRPGGGKNADTSTIRVRAAAENNAADFFYGFLGTKGESPELYGYDEYFFEKSPEWAALPKQVTVEVKFNEAKVQGDGPRRLMIRFQDAKGTVFQWNLAKVNSYKWTPYATQLKQSVDGFYSWNESVKDAQGKTVTHGKGDTVEVVPPVKLLGLIIHSQAPGDDAHGIMALRNLRIEP